MIPKHLTALANHTGAAILHAGGMLIPVKIMDIEHEEHPVLGSTTAFKAMVVDASSLSTTELVKSAKTVTNSVYGAQAFREPVSKTGLPQVDTYAALFSKQADAISARTPCVVKAPSPFEIDRVLFNGPATIVFWKNGDKTIVISRDGEMYDRETDLALCFTLRQLGIAKVIFNNPTTTATWENGAVTSVNCQHGDIWSKETGLFTVIAKKALGNKGNFNEIFKKHIPNY